MKPALPKESQPAGKDQPSGQQPETRDDLTAEIEQNRLRLAQYRERSKEPQHAELH